MLTAIKRCNLSYETMNHVLIRLLCAYIMTKYRVGRKSKTLSELPLDLIRNRQRD